MRLKRSSHLSVETMHAMLDYLQGEVEMAKTPADIAAILKTVKDMFSAYGTFNTVQGLPNIRAEIQAGSKVCAPQEHGQYNVATNVPQSLISTFYDLSNKMNQLQAEDPETFNNASKALHWLANNDKEFN